MDTDGKATAICVLIRVIRTTIRESFRRLRKFSYSYSYSYSFVAVSVAAAPCCDIAVNDTLLMSVLDRLRGFGSSAIRTIGQCLILV